MRSLSTNPVTTIIRRSSGGHAVRPISQLSVQLSIAVFLVLLAAQTVVADPSVQWSSPSLVQVVPFGGVANATVSFTTSDTIRTATLRLVPELARFAQTLPATVTNLAAGATVNVTIKFKIPADAVPGTYEGTLQVGTGSRTLARPLPIRLTVVAPSVPLASVDGQSLVFKDQFGSVSLSVPLLNQTKVEQTPIGELTTILTDIPTISDDRTRASVHSLVIQGLALETGRSITSTFRYYDATGLLWQVVAPPERAFLRPQRPTERIISADGSRVLLISVELGNARPVLSVYTNTGTLLYSSVEGTFLGLYTAQLSPNGRYLCTIGATSGPVGDIAGLVQVTDIDAKSSTDLPFDLRVDERPLVQIASDGRFIIVVGGLTHILPSP